MGNLEFVDVDPSYVIPPPFKSLHQGKDGVKEKDKVKRVREPSDDQKAAIREMTSASQMPYEERKRQYAALRRAVYTDASPELVAKYKLSNDAERCSGPKSIDVFHHILPLLKKINRIHAISC